MPDPDDRPRKVPVRDKRRDPKGDAAPVATASSVPPVGADAERDRREEKHDYLGDLQRLQAEFENYRKRMMRDQAGITERATGRLLENLLPILDNFERAISHGEGGEGVALVFRQLRDTLAREGLEEVPALGERFDPQVHEAIAAHEDREVAEPIVREVSRRGYAYKGQLLRPAMVVVATPSADRSDVAAEEAVSEDHGDN
ncbi:MAG: nucleotide exchange factor GrpE [Actinomycetota bacterium]